MTKNFQALVKSYPDINKINKYKNNNFGNGSTAFLKDFYVNVWCTYDDYVKNDLILYEIFKEENNHQKFIIEARVAVLDKMYGTQINAIRKIIDTFKPDKHNNDFNSIIQSLAKAKNKQKNEKQSANKLESQFAVRIETSFVSKYFHWYNEVNQNDQSPKSLFTATPIYDLNVCAGAVIYKCYKDPKKDYKYNLKEFKEFISIKAIKDDEKKEISLIHLNSSSVKNKLDYDEIKEFIDNFIKKLDPNLNGADRIQIDKEFKNFPKKEYNCLYENVSIYRLVDKFLWLTYKINKDDKLKSNIPQQVIDAYNDIFRKIAK